MQMSEGTGGGVYPLASPLSLPSLPSLSSVLAHHTQGLVHRKKTNQRTKSVRSRKDLMRTQAPDHRCRGPCTGRRGNRPPGPR